MPEQKDYTNNTPVPQRKPKEALVKTPVVERKKKGVTERLVNGLIGPNGVRAIAKYIGSEIVLPMVKNVFVDSFTTGLNMAVFGDEGQKRNNNSRSNVPWNNNSRSSQNNKTSYNTQYQNSQITRANVNSSTMYSIREVGFPNRDEAAMVLDTMRYNIDQYGQVSVADYYDWVGMSNITTYTDVNYGWTDLYSARIITLRGGMFGITLPPADVIES